MEEESKLPKKIEALIKLGLPLSKVKFQTTVDSHTNEPEFNYFDGGTHRASRNAKLYWTSIGVIKVQGEQFEIIPLANVKQGTILV